MGGRLGAEPTGDQGDGQGMLVSTLAYIPVVGYYPT